MHRGRLDQGVLKAREAFFRTGVIETCSNKNAPAQAEDTTSKSTAWIKVDHVAESGLRESSFDDGLCFNCNDPRRARMSNQNGRKRLTTPVQL
jgi:hypothetical protein